MSLAERFERWNYKMQLKSALRMAKYTLKLRQMDQIPFIELEKMADQAELLVPKLQKELEELDHEQN